MSSINMFGQYESQETRALRSIDSSKYPDTNHDLEANLRRLNSFVDYISQYLQIMQKGVDQANQDAFQRTREILSNISILLAGGTVLDMDLGDLQYFLPALGALFGFDAETPFPINLFHAAEHFLLGYVIPLDSFAYAIEEQIIAWATAFGLNEDFINSISELAEALSSITVDLSDFFTELMGLLNIFNITDIAALEPFGDLWHAISILLGGLSLSTLGELTDPVFAALAPWVYQLANAVSWLDKIVKAFSKGTMDILGIINFASMFDSIDFLAENFNPVGALLSLINGIINSVSGIDLTTAITDLVEIIKSFSGGILDITGILNFANMFGDINFAAANFDPIEALTAVVDSIFSPLNTSVDAISTAVDELNQIIKAFSGGLLDMTGILNFASLFGTIDFNAPDFNLVTAATKWVKDVLTPTGLLAPNWGDLLQGITGQPGGSLTDLANLLQDLLFGPISPNRIPMLPVSALSSFNNVNLLEAPTFDSVRSLVGKGIWEWDANVGRTTNGSSRATLDGNDKILWSNEIFVAPGDEIDFSIYYRSVGLVGPETAIGFDIVTFNGQTKVSTHTGTSTVGTPDPAKPEWRSLATTFTVPNNGCDRIRMQLRVGAAATAGQVWFDDGVATKQRTLLPQEWIQDLPGDLQSIVNSIGQGASNLVDVIFKPSQLFEVINNLLKGIQDANASIAEILNREKPSGGVDVAVRFDVYPNGAVPGDFRLIATAGAGGVVIKDGCMDWEDSGSAAASRMYIYSTTALATDIFEVTAVVPRPCEDRVLSGPSYNYLVGASNAAGTEHCIVRFGNEGVQFGYAAGSAVVENVNWVGSFTGSKPQAGAAIRFRGEMINGRPQLSVYVNNRPAATYTDSAGVMKIDASHRYCGIGFAAANRALGQATPGSVSMFLMSDGMPPSAEIVV